VASDFDGSPRCGLIAASRVCSSMNPVWSAIRPNRRSRLTLAAGWPIVPVNESCARAEDWLGGPGSWLLVWLASALIEAAQVAKLPRRLNAANLSRAGGVVQQRPAKRGHENFQNVPLPRLCHAPWFSTPRATKAPQNRR
jgi:hypothetical protein